MWKPHYGHPTLTVRLPIWQHTGLRVVARRHDTTVSALLQNYVRDLLASEGITGDTTTIIPGQTRIPDDA